MTLREREELIDEIAAFFAVPVLRRRFQIVAFRHCARWLMRHDHVVAAKALREHAADLMEEAAKAEAAADRSIVSG